MSKSAKNPAKRLAKVDALMEKASTALVETRYFESERLSLEALQLARGANDFERMGRICLPLLEARRQKRLAAVDSGRFVVLDDKSDEPKLAAGCYVFEPLLVAADAREMRDRADAEEVPVFVLAREPSTSIGLWPVAMIGPVTVRTRLKPPVGGEVDLEWMQMASEALGDSAIESLDLDRPGWHRVDQLLDRLATVPEHEKLHQLLEQTCREAAIEAAAGETPPADDDFADGDETLDG